jgi:nitric oxide reductase NorQ protein
LIYDEFTRSRPETNNILLSILEEKMLETSNTFNNSRYLKVHPDFKAIFTSNSQEYVGVHKIQDALLDRMITINMEYMDAETEREIVRAKGNVSYEDADRIVNIIREFRNNDKCTIKPSLRSGIMIGKIIRENGSHASKEDAFFRKVAFDVLASKIGAGVKSRDNEKSVKENEINELIEKYC